VRLGELEEGVHNSPRGGVGYGADGTIWGQFQTQLIGVASVMVWSAVASAVLMLALKATLGLRASHDDIDEGLDLTQHGERGYTL
jgi:Amt family ammonium transporter